MSSMSIVRRMACESASAYTLSVMATFSWPRMSDTLRMSAPFEIAAVANLWRRS